MSDSNIADSILLCWYINEGNKYYEKTEETEMYQVK